MDYLSNILQSGPFVALAIIALIALFISGATMYGLYLFSGKNSKRYNRMAISMENRFCDNKKTTVMTNKQRLLDWFNLKTFKPKEEVQHYSKDTIYIFLDTVPKDVKVYGCNKILERLNSEYKEEFAKPIFTTCTSIFDLKYKDRGYNIVAVDKDGLTLNLYYLHEDISKIKDLFTGDLGFIQGKLSSSLSLTRAVRRIDIAVFVDRSKLPRDYILQNLSKLLENNYLEPLFKIYNKKI